MNLLLGIISGILGSIADSYRKKAIDNANIGKSSFALISAFFGTILVYIFSIIKGEELNIFSDYYVFLIVFTISLIQIFTNFTIINIYKKVKISELLPYGNIGTLFTIIFGFLLFYGTEKQTSLITFLITLFTVFIVILSNFNFRKTTFSKYIFLYIIALILDSSIVMTVGFLLLKFSALNYMTLSIFIDFLLYFSLVIFLKESFKSMFNQTKVFYKARFLAIFIGRIGYFIGLYIIETSGVLIASLISFLTIVFSVFSMKYILGDTPSRKQIFLAFVVTLLIGIGYYFK